MYWALRFGFGMGVVPNDVFLVHLESLPKFPWRKSSNVLPYFRGGNLAVLRLKCVIVHKTLLLPSFQRENTAIGMPHFHNKYSAGFRIYVYGTYRHARIVTS